MEEKPQGEGNYSKKNYSEYNMRWHSLQATDDADNIYASSWHKLQKFSVFSSLRAKMEGKPQGEFAGQPEEGGVDVDAAAL